MRAGQSATRARTRVKGIEQHLGPCLYGTEGHRFESCRARSQEAPLRRGFMVFRRLRRWRGGTQGATDGATCRRLSYSPGARSSASQRRRSNDTACARRRSSTGPGRSRRLPNGAAVTSAPASWRSAASVCTGTRRGRSSASGAPSAGRSATGRRFGGAAVEGSTQAGRMICALGSAHLL